MKRKSFIGIVLLALVLLSSTLYAQNFKKKTYKNDPMNVIHYTLDNGLQVYLSVNKDVPKIQTYIAVRVGSKNDPQESTGLSHYLEHLMFKGTTHFGTVDWNKEKVYLDQIEKLYEVYNKTTDENERKAIYKQIDSVSYLASKYAIPNEYDKMMSLIGSQNTNAFTSNDMTVYQEEIPSNELERWLLIEADRFTEPVFRLFHTELESVYEEKNMTMANDSRSVMEKLNYGLYPTHPYGTQTTIGKAEHLKNPSLQNIKHHFDSYYVPNNYCIALSGDFEPEQAIKLINKYFGSIPAKTVPEFKCDKLKPITSVQVQEVVGLEAEMLRIGFRLNGGNGSKDVMLATLIDLILSNGKSGLIDENMNLKQKAMYAASSVYSLNDYASFLLFGKPKQGQTLEELKDILLEQIDIVKKGEWDESLLAAAINNFKLERMKELESNSSRAMKMIEAYLAHQDWQDVIDELDKLSQITKKEIVDYANEIFKDNNYVVVYKRQGEKQDTKKIDKPEITPVFINRDVESAFLAKIKDMKVKPIEPVFVNYDKDMKKAKLINGSELLYVQNKQNGRFELEFRYDYGYRYAKNASLVNSFLKQLESEHRSVNQINREMYDIACTYNISLGSEYSTIRVSGLSENMDKAIAIVEDIINYPKLSEQSVENNKLNILKSRKDNKSQQNTILSNLTSYATYGKENALKYVVSDEDIKAINAEEILTMLNMMTSQHQTILYYGDKTLSDVQKTIEQNHKFRQNKMLLRKEPVADALPITDNQVFFVHYDAKQSLCRTISYPNLIYDKENPITDLYNEYFGGGMNSIVFQEIREKRSLAYSSYAYFSTPSEINNHYTNISHIATQNDKLIDALDAFYGLFDDMPQSQQAFEIAKQSLVSQMRTSRITKTAIMSSYLNDKKKNRPSDWRQQKYKALQSMTLDDVVNFNKNYIKNQKRTVVVLGNENEVDFKTLQKFGQIKQLSLEEVFGY
ncbi:MAG: insulinase family protein [Bacteroidales bacterium]|nr:insulinase family protein [Bacteroidales bacterium]